jgi:hypothetical protein
LNIVRGHKTLDPENESALKACAKE